MPIPYGAQKSSADNGRAFCLKNQPLDSQADSFMLVYRYMKAEAEENRKMTTETAAASSYSMLENSLRRYWLKNGNFGTDGNLITTI